MALLKRTKRITTATTAQELRAIRRVAATRKVKPSLLLRELSVNDVMIEYTNLLAWDKERPRAKKGPGHDQSAREQG